MNHAKTLEGAIALVKKHGWKGVNIIRFPRGRTFYIAWKHAPQEGEIILWSD